MSSAICAGEREKRASRRVGTKRKSEPLKGCPRREKKKKIGQEETRPMYPDFSGHLNDQKKRGDKRTRREGNHAEARIESPRGKGRSTKPVYEHGSRRPLGKEWKEVDP